MISTRPHLSAPLVLLFCCSAGAAAQAPTITNASEYKYIGTLTRRTLEARFQELKPSLIQRLRVAVPTVPTAMGRQRINWESTRFWIEPASDTTISHERLQEIGAVTEESILHEQEQPLQWNCDSRQAQIQYGLPAKATAFARFGDLRIRTHISPGPVQAEKRFQALLRKREGSIVGQMQRDWRPEAAPFRFPPFSVVQPALQTVRKIRRAQVRALAVLDVELLVRWEEQDFLTMILTEIGFGQAPGYRLGRWSGLVPNTWERAFLQQANVETSFTRSRRLLKLSSFPSTAACHAARQGWQQHRQLNLPILSQSYIDP